MKKLLDILVQEKKHSCRICQKVIRHDNQFIWTHLSNAHSMKLSTYYQHYILSNEGVHNKEQSGKSMKKEELLDEDDITEGMLLVDKDMDVMNNAAASKPKKKLLQAFPAASLINQII